jgi:ABC-2 type transport system ATP-binding protein
MWMKTALSSSLAYHPRVLILDEVFSALDVLVRDDLIENPLDHAGETTILISSHDLAEIETIASHICYLDRGRVQFADA